MHTLFALLWVFPDVELRGTFPWPAALALGLLAVVVVGWLYAREAGRLSVPTRAALGVVRVAVVVAVAFLLLRPVVVKNQQEQKLRPVAVLIDVSQSMDSADPRPNPDDQNRASLAFAGSAESPGNTPDRPKRIEVARAALLNPKFDLFNRLSQVGPLEVYTFGTQRTGRDPGNSDWLKNLQATESSTALVQAAFELLNRDDADAPAAIVVVSDGRENAGPRSLAELGRECGRRGIPIFVYGVGSSAFGQLQIAFGSGSAGAGGRVGADVDVPGTLFVDDLTSVPVRYSVKGMTEGVATITLKYGDREVATKKETFTLAGDEVREGKTFATVLTFTPTKADAEANKQEYSATVSITNGAGAAADTLSSTISHPAQIVNRKLKVLWVDGLPRRDFQFLQRDLLRDRRIEAKFFLTEGDKLAMRSGPPWMVEFSNELDGVLQIKKEEFRKLLFDFDLLILGDVPGKFFTDEHKVAIEAFVKGGGGLIHIAGRWHSPHDLAVDKIRLDKENKGRKEEEKIVPLADLLPVEVQPVRWTPDLATGGAKAALPSGPAPESLVPQGPFVPVLAPAAARTTIVSLEDDPIDNAERWGKPGPQPDHPGDKQLKPMYWFYPVTKVKPAADVFLTHPTARTPDGKPMPLLAGHHYGEGYVLYVGFDDTWRWRFNNQSKLSGRFWTQAIYTAGIPRIVGTKRTQLSTNTPSPVTGTTGEVYVRLYDANFDPVSGRTDLTGTLEKLDAGPNDKDRTRTVPFAELPGAKGVYVATLAYTDKDVGQYKLSVDGEGKNPAVLKYTVSYPENHELSPGALDEPAMRKLARDSRAGADGGFYREENLDKLPADVQPQKSPLTHREEILLWNGWVMVLLIGLLTTEWFLRKFNGLS
jgi:hypothetical protein